MNTPQKQAVVKWLVILTVLLLLLAIAGWLLQHNRALDQMSARHNLTIALPNRIGGGALFVGQDRKIFEQHGLNITIHTFPTGKLALQGLLDGTSDLVVLADTPFMFAILKNEKIAAFANIFSSRKIMAIVARNESGINKESDLAGKKIGTVLGTNAQYFLDTFLTANAVNKSTVTIVSLKTDELVDALKTGKVDAATVWDPDLAKIKTGWPAKFHLFFDKNVFVYRYLLVGKQSYVAEHQAEIRKVLASIIDANLFIQDHPLQAQELIGKSIGMDPVLMSTSFDRYDFDVSLDQTLLQILDRQTRWAMSQGLATRVAIPNYLDFIRQEPLKAVSPSAVKIFQ